MSSSFLVAALVAASSLYAPVNGHMTLKQPAPYGASSLTTSPLDASGSDFPCKQRDGVYAPASSTNSYAIGDDVPLSFSGSASHGGGSCQISLSTDTAPTKNSVWKVLRSIEGGCPVRNSDGNTGSDTFSFKIPDGVPEGNNTLAWTWFNKIGNREMYMNCAPITITGVSSKTKRNVEARKASPLQSKRDNTFSSFPDMFVANICSQKCTTVDNANVLFPNPGVYVDNFGGSQPSAKATCTCDAAGSSAAETGSGSSGSAVSGVSSAAASIATSAAAAGPPSATSVATAASAAVSAPAPAAASGAASSGSADSGILPTAVATVTAQSTAAAAATGAPSAGSSTGSSTGSTGNTTSCSGGASVICSADGSQFALCSDGPATMQKVAPGTKCVRGNIVAA